MDTRKIKDKKAPPSKQYYTVKLEVKAPLVLTYRVYAEDSEQALDFVLKNPLIGMAEPARPILAGMRRLKGTVYRAGSSLIELVKKLGE